MVDGFEVDVAVVAAAGARLVRSAEVLRQQAVDVGRFGFTGTAAGRDYAAKGDALRDALGVVATTFEVWATGTESIGLTLRADATRYGAVDHGFASDVNGVQW
ncbi:MAG: hypothetical protein WAW17_28215 [Rhodococcus sp. (in: high G+C Gram-positive bacteria)]|uniref:hypothetical protein n=1 Tax=Rhodococcus sp. TaxID=1831 RepID=UPI003BAED899